MPRRILIPLLGALAGALIACGDDGLLSQSQEVVAALDGRPGPAEALHGQELDAGLELQALANANIRSGPSTSAPVLGVVPRDVSVQVLEGTPREGFYKVSFSGLRGWTYGAHYRERPSVMSLEQALTANEILSRAATAVGFSYWWGHGRWNPASLSHGSCSGSCPSCSHSGSYGADCSGFAAKVWQVPSTNTDFTVDSHPYSTYDFDNTTIAWDVVSRGSAQPGDAFVYNEGSGHIFIYQKGDPWGSMWAYECRGCASGCVHDVRTAGTAYKVIRRRGLTTTPPPPPPVPNRLDVFVLGASGQIHQKYYEAPAGWSDVYGVLGAPSVGIVGEPTAVSWGANRIDLFVRGGDNALWHKWWDGSAWSAWQLLGGTLSSSPEASSWGSGRLDVFVLGGGGNIYQKYFKSGVGWSNYGSLGAPPVGAVGEPSAVSWGPDRLDVFVRGGDDAVWHKWWDGESWSIWQSLGGTVTSSPDVSSREYGRLDVFARGGGNDIYQKYYLRGAGWSDWGSMGAPTGGATSSPGAVSWDVERIDLFVRGGDNALWHKWWDGSTWRGWESLGGTLVSGPDVASWSR